MIFSVSCFLSISYHSFFLVVFVSSRGDDLRSEMIGRLGECEVGVP